MNPEHASHDHDHHHDHAHPQAGDAPGPGYERKDASASKLLWSGGILVVILVGIHLAMLAFFGLFKSERPEAVEEKSETKATNIYQQLRDLRRDEDTKLSSYGWVDRKAGVVRVPIGRAIELVAEKGVRFGKGPKTEIEMNSHSGTPVGPPPAPKDAEKPPEGAGAGAGAEAKP